MQYFQQLISCADLHANIDNPNFVILDASIPPVGNMASPLHSWPNVAIKHARRFDLNNDFSDPSSTLPHTMPSPALFEEKARALGINTDCQIVVYDDQGLFSAARAWYMFKAMGHKNIAVLDGGLPLWLKLQYQQVSCPQSSSLAQGNFTAVYDESYFCDWLEVLAQSKSMQQLIIDARSAERFFAKVAEPRSGVRSGHMPNAKNLPYHRLLEQGAFKPAEQLAAIFNEINPEKRAMIMSCGSGVTACILVLAAQISGVNACRVYDGSWSEWGLSKTLPVVVND